MKVFVYGTLKKTYGNNRLLVDCKLVEESVLPGYKLYYSFGNHGFPVAFPCENSFVKGEVYEIPEDISVDVIRNLDFLESNGYMYNRTMIDDDTFLYVGHKDNWPKREDMTECPVKNNIYVWDRVL
jgi:gamma-glutamylcyclotransferase (GGCT)/AIG2-like uncharacterized protein YtfP